MIESMLWERMQAFFHSWFVERDLDKTVGFLSEDICFVGTGDGEGAQGGPAMYEYLRQDIAQITEPFSCKEQPLYCQPLSPELYALGQQLLLNNSLYSWKLCMTVVFRREAEGRWLICNLNASDPSAKQQEGEHYPDTLVLKRIKEARQELLSESIMGGMMGGYMEPGFPFYFINRQMLEHLGYRSEGEFVQDIGGMVSHCMHPDDRAAVDVEVDRQLAGSNEYVVEYRMKKRDGSYIWVHDLGRRIKAEDGRDAIISVCMDITDSKQLKDDVQQKYEREISNFSALSTVDCVAQGRVNITQNRVEAYSAAPGMALLYPGDRHEDAARALNAFAADSQQLEQLRQLLQPKNLCKAFAEGRLEHHFELLRRRDDGRLFFDHTHLRLSQNPETGDIVLLFNSTDETRRFLQQRLLDRLVEQDYDNILEVDLRDGTYHSAAYRPGAPMDALCFEADIHQVAQKWVAEKYREEFERKLGLAYMRAQLNNEGAYSFSIEMRNAAGELRTKRYQVFYISPELEKVCVAGSDVTDVVQREQKQREELSVALLAAEQANAAKTNFLSRMSHEIRTPMNAIIGMAAIAAQSVGDDDTVNDCLSKIGISSRFLLSLINDILDMSRIESGKMLLKNEEIPTEEFINGINAICYGQAENKGVDYECVVDPVLDDYYIGDAMKLQQVLINVLGNAIKFTEPGGTVNLSIQQRGRKKDSAQLRFIVNDTGVGMSEEFLPHVFESFTQESTGTTALYGGTGLGMAISKNIIDLMGGKITVRSIKDIGTEFTIDVALGLSDKEKAHRGRHGGAAAPNFSHLKTLVVDDDVTVCESAMITLKEMGIKAEWVDSGCKAVERVKKMWDSGVYYDLILIDWKMPEMNGIETARRIRAIVGHEVTIIIMTAYDWNGIEHEARMAGVNLLMSKPMFKSSLVSAFSKVLGEKEEQEQSEKPVVFDFSGKRVLLAEDNAINTEVAVKLLKSKGFEVETAKNGLRALEMFSKSPKGYYNAILMDIRMPLMDGLTATTSIRHLSNADARTVPIIAMTANAFDDDVDKSKAAGMNAHLAKPIDPQRLYQTLYDFIFAGDGAQS